MSFWNTEKWIERCKEDKVVLPFSPHDIKNGAYELSLGRVYYATDHKTKLNIEKEEQIEVRPGEFALLETEEKVIIPKDVMGFISIKATTKFRGIINVSGFHVDPGYEGKLVFGIYNAGSKSLLVTRGQKLFLIWMAELVGKTADGYKGGNGKGITDDMVFGLHGKVESRSSLSERIRKIEVSNKIMIWAAGLLITTMIAIMCSIISGYLPLLTK